MSRQSDSATSSATASSEAKLPMTSGWSSGTDPRPFVPVRMPAPHASASAARGAPTRRAPPPAQISGRRASRSTAAARSMSRWAPVRVRGVRSSTLFWASGSAVYCRSMGQSTLTGPKGGVSSSVTASVSTARAWRAVSMRMACWETACNMASWRGTSW